MSSSSRMFADAGGDNSKIELPVFILPPELVFSWSIRRALLTIYNPYGNEVQFKIMSTNPDRFDVSVPKGIIKPNRRIDVTIRLLSHKMETELPDPTDELQVIDHFKISIQTGALRGNRQVKVNWIASCVDYSDAAMDDTARLLGTGGASMGPGGALDEMSSKLKLKSLKQQVTASQRNAMQQSSPAFSSSGRLATSRGSSLRSQHLTAPDHHQQHHNAGSNVNLVCLMGALVCIVLLFLPLAIDSELCKKAKLYHANENETSSPNGQPVGILAQLSNLLSVSYEMKFGCSFALGLFTYRLISTMPD